MKTTAAIFIFALYCTYTLGTKTVSCDVIPHGVPGNTVYECSCREITYKSFPVCTVEVITIAPESEESE